MTAPELPSLLALLRDEDSTVRLAVEDRLRELGPEGLAALEIAASSDEPMLRGRARLMHQKLRAEDAAGTLRGLLGQDSCDLERAATLLACVENPSLEREKLDDELNRLADRLAAQLRPTSTVEQVAEAMARVLHEEEGFRGNVDDYYDPRNSYIDAVVSRRLGIPISLSAVYMMVGRRAGLTLSGVGMPCHFLVRLDHEDGSALLDPFGGGRVLSPEDCRALLTGFKHSWRQEYLSPVSDRSMLRRILANLMHIYQRDGDQPRLELFNGFASALQDQNP